MKTRHAGAAFVIVGAILIATNARAQGARGFYTPEQLQDVMSSQVKEASRGALAECKSGFRSAATVARCLENPRVKSQTEFDAASQRMMNEMHARVREPARRRAPGKQTPVLARIQGEV
jgi:hypothetical protein